MFLFFSNRAGCLGSIAISLIGSAVVFLALRGCDGRAIDETSWANTDQFDTIIAGA